MIGYLDIETNMAHDTIWCCVVTDDAGTRVFTDKAGLQEQINGYDKVVGHNIIGFDAPVLRKVWGINIGLNQVEDTLVLSRLYDSQIEGGHSLRAWGERLGDYKDDFTAFDDGLTDEMISYCKQDVAVTKQLHHYLCSKLHEWTDPAKAIELEHYVAMVISRQEKNGFKLDEPNAVDLLNQLQGRMMDIESQLQAVFPPIVEERWSEKTGKRLKDKVTVFNVGSRKQIAERLQGLGVKFEKMTEKGSIIVDESVLAGIDLYEAKLINEYLMLQKREGLVKSWLNALKEDGRVHGRVISNGAVTGRMTHSSPNMGQIPSVKSEYGKECRALWTVEEGNVLVGCDLSGIELRCLAHYMQDDDYTKEILDGDIHTKNQKAAGLPTRDNAKTFIYATLYGGGPAKIGSIVGGGAKEGKRLIDSFRANTPALAKLMDKVKHLAQRGWLPALDGRRVAVRSEHSALNTLLQSAGAIIAKEWCVVMHKQFRKEKIPVKQVAFVHDEIQIEVAEQYADRVGQIMEESATIAGKNLGFRCRVDAESKIGKTWFDTH